MTVGERSDGDHDHRVRCRSGMKTLGKVLHDHRDINHCNSDCAMSFVRVGEINLGCGCQSWWLTAGRINPALWSAPLIAYGGPGVPTCRSAENDLPVFAPMLAVIRTVTVDPNATAAAGLQRHREFICTLKPEPSADDTKYILTFFRSLVLPTHSNANTCSRPPPRLQILS